MGQQQERWTGARIATMVGLWVLAMPALGLLIGNLALPRWLEPVGAAATAPGGDCAAGGAEGACSASGHGPDEAIAWLAQERAARGDRNVLFTRDRLKLFDGSVAGRPLVLCVMGECFDVSDGEQFYGAGAHYSCFAGNDGSRAYVKGEFTAEACHDDVSDFTGPEMIGVEHWLNFYKQHEHYRRVGVLVGRYHDATGAETSDRVALLQRAVQQRHDEISLKILPGCNSKFVAARAGSPAKNEVWCSPDSGGIERHWTGLPRLERQEGTSGRCVCVPTERLDEQALSEYPDCAPDAHRCEV